MSVRDDEDLRPSRRTPNLGLPVPGDAGPADYVTDTGNLADTLDDGGAFFFPGDLKLSAARAAPPGWLVCDGRSVSRTVYNTLFRAVGDVWGADDDETFKLPDFRSRVPLGGGNGRVIGATGGEERVTLAVAEMPHHAHGVSDPTHVHGVGDGGHAHGFPGMSLYTGAADINLAAGGISYGYFGATYGAATGVGIHGAYTGIGIIGEGGSGAHNNLPPFAVVNVFIKT